MSIELSTVVKRVQRSGFLQPKRQYESVLNLKSTLYFGLDEVGGLHLAEP